MLEMPDGSIALPKQHKNAKPVAKGRREHMTGQVVFGPDEGAAMDIEGHTELQIGLLVLSRPGVVELENQVPFVWIDDAGVSCTHFFDFRATMESGSRTAIFAKAEFRLKSALILGTDGDRLPGDARLRGSGRDHDGKGSGPGRIVQRQPVSRRSGRKLSKPSRMSSQRPHA